MNRHPSSTFLFPSLILSRKGSDMCRMKLVMAAAIAAVAVQLLCVHSANAATEDTAPKPPIKRVSPDDAAPRTALVVQDNVAMRAAAKDSSPAQAQLWRGEALEIRGERPDHFQVYDYRRERGGFVRKAALLPLNGPAAQPEALLAALRVVRQQPGAESLGLGLAAAYVQAAGAAQMNGVDGAEALDAMGTLAERLADRASRAQSRSDGVATVAPSATETQVAAQLDVAARYGLRFRTLEREAGAMQLCYDGEAFRRVLAMPASTPEQKARAALALTRVDCLDPVATPPQREQMDQWRADVLDKVDLRDPALATHWRNRVLMRQSGVWSSLAFIRARRAGAVSPAMKPAIGFFRPFLASSLRNCAASSSADPPISPIMMIDFVASSAMNSSSTSMKFVPLTGSPPMPTAVV